MNYRLGTLAATGLISLSLLAGCNDKGKTDAPASTPESAAASVSEEDTLATVNGSPITKEDVVAFMQLKQQTQPGAQMNPGLLLNEMINTRLLVQEAESKGIQDTEEVKRMLKMQRAATLVSVVVRDYLDSLELSYEELKAEYDAQIAGVDKDEYKASHILLENEEDAKKVITQVKPDASNFADLAKEKSTGPSGKDGGDLGWFSARSMVPEFADAVTLNIELPDLGCTVMISGRVRRVAPGSRELDRLGGFGLEFTRFYSGVGRDSLRQHLVA